MSKTDWIIVVATVFAGVFGLITFQLWMTCRDLKEKLTAQKAETAWRSHFLVMLQTPPRELYEVLEELRISLREVTGLGETEALMDRGLGGCVRHWENAHHLMRAYQTARAIVQLNEETTPRQGGNAPQSDVKPEMLSCFYCLNDLWGRQRLGDALEKTGMTASEVSLLLAEKDALEVVVALCGPLYDALRASNAKIGDVINEAEFGATLTSIVKTTQDRRRARIDHCTKQARGGSGEIAVIHMATGIDLSLVQRKDTAGVSTENVEPLPASNDAQG